MSGIDPALRIRSVTLGVSDLDRSADFYERALGLPLIARENGTALLGTDGGQPALVLTQIEQPDAPATGRQRPLPRRLAAPLAGRAGGHRCGAWPVPAGRWRGPPTTASRRPIYLSDPDGLGIEIYADRPRERWARTPDGGVEMVTLPLDLEDLLAQSTGEPADAIAPGTGVGHVHMKVADVGRASRFYGEDRRLRRAGPAALRRLPRSRGLPPPHRPELLAERGRPAFAGHRAGAAGGALRAGRRGGIG